MVSLLTSPSIHNTWPSASTQVLVLIHFSFTSLSIPRFQFALSSVLICSYICKFKLMHQLGLYRHSQSQRSISFVVRSEHLPSTSASPCQGTLAFIFMTFYLTEIKIEAQIYIFIGLSCKIFGNNMIGV